MSAISIMWVPVREIEFLSLDMFHRERGSETIDYGFFLTNLGTAMMAAVGEQVCFLGFVDAGDETLVQRVLTKSRPNSRFTRQDERIAELGQRVFGSAASSVSVQVVGTPFQIVVWRALCEIPMGDTVSYGQVAHQIGRPTAVRAVARAIAGNPAAVLIPCHRVISGTGELTGYRWGLDRKRQLLEMESAQRMLHC